ncbi:hypothetical protein D9M71_273780 [compost metagenome]
MGQFQGTQYAGRAHRAAANLRLGKAHRLSIGLQEKFFGGTGRGGFTAVVGAHGFAIPKYDECAATDARRLWLDQRQHRLHRNRGIDGRAAPAQHLPPGFGCQRVGRRCHEFLGVLSFQIGAETGSAFRGERQRRHRSVVARGQGQGTDDQRQGRQAMAAQSEG